ncbi:isopentenyl-diphosphate Delta-isomerase [Monoraphidium neglectum]|uniref:Methylthioribose-1-phosphate isomerase n=1 Tax=Monoraphidium neglectum TaxID=145388 RepID=A0A0D2MW39_9CHLO|nr:isopentenyl-diphosphate Delta-isomerase [Monoraphidium neglectum]KIZ04682.1 isopentenyl-diphosphate Delta-isomerase [Monoraphidium neglectum]|eukprot:XP_013903701.1 isopentenyl-diphosphate Delta-isomerase [Monoraphidium neglectum]
MGSLIAIRYDRASGLSLLDQRKLPFETAWLPTPTPQDAWQQIKDMVVRGAPAIGVTGALSLASHLTRNGGGKQYSSVAAVVEDVEKTMDYLVTSRPTAVNLADSATKLKAVARQAAAAEGATPESVTAEVVAAAEATLEEDIAANKAIGAAGAKALLDAVAARGRTRSGGKVRVLTHCNTGSLATAAYGTALGIIRALHDAGALEHAYCTETRPYNQGARLTAFELVHDGLPATLICDSAAAALMGAGDVDAVVVGADRVVANGDTANKIGTYALGIAAAHHSLPFFVAAPTTTLDASLPSGAAIVIEQRPPEEITHFRGQRVAAEGIGIWNPCFDVVPGSLVEGIVTERGVVPRDHDSGGHAVRAFMGALGLWSPPAASGNGNGNGDAAADGSAAAEGGDEPKAVLGRPLGEEGVRGYVAARPALAEKVGPPEGAADWQVEVRADGNINFVYLVTGPAGGLCVKESLPYVRCVGESWPLSRDRCRIEAEALRLQHALASAHVPRVFHFDGGRSLIAMEYVAPPAIILRHGIVAGLIYPRLAGHVAAFLAATLFNTSLLALDSRAFSGCGSALQGGAVVVNV